MPYYPHFLTILFCLTISITAPVVLGAEVRFPDAPTVEPMTVEVADSNSKRMRGLMFRNGLTANSGMWFVFPDDKVRYFWMKNVSFPIDIIFIDHDFVIRKIWASVPPCSKEPCPNYSSVEKVRYVLEVPSQFCIDNGVFKGQRVKYSP